MRQCVISNTVRFDLQKFKQFSCSASSRVLVKNLEETTDTKSDEAKKKKSILKEFGRLTVWKDEKSLVNDLYSNIVYYEPERDKSGIVILNKPYGLSKEQSDDSQFSLARALPLLAKELDVPSLTVLKSTERFTSGITVLGTKPESAKALESCLLRHKSSRILANSYLALVKGQPNVNRTESVDLQLVDCPEVNSPLFSSMHKEPMISRELKTVSQGRRQAVRRVHVDVETVSRSSSGAGLVAVSPSNPAKHFVLVYLAELGVPVLGDMMYDYRSKTLLGQKIRVTATTNAYRTQILPAHLLQLLGLEKGEEWRLPKLLHHHRLHLAGWLQDGADLTVFAPPPSHWLSVAEILGISFDFKTFAGADQVKQWNKREQRKMKKKKKSEEIIITDLQSDVTQLS